MPPRTKKTKVTTVTYPSKSSKLYRKAMRYKTYRKFGLTNRGGLNITRFGSDWYINNGASAGTVVVGTGGTLTDNMVRVGAPSITPGWGYYVPFTLSFTPNMIQNYNELANICDKVKISKIVVKVTFNHNVSTASGTSGLPELQWVQDDDDNIPAGPGLMKEKMGVKRKTFTADRRHHYITIYPKVIQNASIDASGGVLNSASLMVKPSGYFDAQFNDLRHFGVKGYFSNLQLPASLDIVSSIKFEPKFFLKLRNIR